MNSHPSTATLGRIGWLAGLALLIAAPFIGLYPVFMMKAQSELCANKSSRPACASARCVCPSARGNRLVNSSIRCAAWCRCR